MNEKQRSRNSTIEALRILAIILIISWHYSTQYGNGGVLATGFSLYHIFAITLGSWGQLGVDLFLVISIYYLKDNNKFSLKRFLFLFAETVFYALFWIAMCKGILHIDYTVKFVIKYCLALFLGTYWFITAYAIIYCMHPLLNNIINSCSDKHLKKFAIAIFFFASVYRTIYREAPVCDVLFFLSVYFLVCYIDRCFRDKLLNVSKRWFIILTAALMLINISFVWVGDRFNLIFFLSNSLYLHQRGSALLLLDAIFLFYWFLSLPKSYYKTINLLASTSLGVYLSHQGVSAAFWMHFLSKTFSSEGKSIAHMIYSIILIFVGCALIDIVRQRLFEKVLTKIFTNHKIQMFVNFFDHKMND